MDRIANTILPRSPVYAVSILSMRPAAKTRHIVQEMPFAAFGAFPFSPDKHHIHFSSNSTYLTYFTTALLWRHGLHVRHRLHLLRRRLRDRQVWRRYLSHGCLET